MTAVEHFFIVVGSFVLALLLLVLSWEIVWPSLGNRGAIGCGYFDGTPLPLPPEDPPCRTEDYRPTPPRDGIWCRVRLDRSSSGPIFVEPTGDERERLARESLELALEAAEREACRVRGSRWLAAYRACDDALTR
jgi:hypothetical protein